MTDSLRLRIITRECWYEEWDVDSIPNLSLYPLQQGKVHKTRTPKRDYREQGEKKHDERKSNNDSR